MAKKLKGITVEQFRKGVRLFWENVLREGATQSKRAGHGYDLEEPVDYDVPEGEGKGLGEAAELEDQLEDQLKDIEDEEVKEACDKGE